ncbi:hypothetical protein CGX12_05535 [Zobellella denitrificans]|jgi:chromosome segregation ATPase|uniref:Uncharacterized protein n=1 Tax=Zobellella denitrificans TaxID=347534 RepID=A0A231N0T8_9GAMM|nr:hypothetical protein [Zobellella denitrificans]ATG72776.1 hypothetical protein AN401_02020 [Zobellella denitrificans]OXS16094.1 hypothetical protein CGX12_05535 [Zobellella denitrificans]
MSVLGQVLRSLQDPQDGSLDPDRVCVQLVRACRHAEQHMQGLARQCRQLKAERQLADRRERALRHELHRQEQGVLATLAAGHDAHAQATEVARLEDRQDELAADLARLEKRLGYYQRRWLEAERHYHDLCRQLAMAKTTACVRKTMAAIRRHPAVTLVNAKQALADIRAREQRQHQDTEPDEAPRALCPHSAEQVLARLQQQLGGRP